MIRNIRATRNPIASGGCSSDRQSQMNPPLRRNDSVERKLAREMSFCCDSTDYGTKRYEGIDAYLAGVPATHRASLKNSADRSRNSTQSHGAHQATACPSSSWTATRWRVSGRAKRHCGLFVWSSTALGTLGDLLDGYNTAIGTVRFAPDEPLPERIIKAVLRARANEIKDRWGREA